MSRGLGDVYKRQGLAIVKALAQRMGHTAFAQLENGVFTVGVRWHMYR